MKMPVQANPLNQGQVKSDTKVKTDQKTLQKTTIEDKSSKKAASKPKGTSFSKELHEAAKGEKKDKQSLSDMNLSLLIASLPPAIQQMLSSGDSHENSSLKLTKEILSILKQGGKNAKSLLTNPNFQKWLHQVQQLLSKSLKANGQDLKKQSSPVTSQLSSLQKETVLPMLEFVNDFNKTISIEKKTQINNQTAMKLLNDFIDFAKKEPTSKKVDTMEHMLKQLFLVKAKPFQLQSVHKNKGNKEDSQTIPLSSKPVIQAQQVSAHQNKVEDKPGIVQAKENLQTNSFSIPLQSIQLLKQEQVVQPEKAVHEQIPIKNFAENMNRIMIQNMKVGTLSNGITTARISLLPENLGQVNVQIAMQHGQLVAHFSTDNLLGKQALESQMPVLRAALQNQGIHVQKMEVTQNNQTTSNFFSDQRSQQQSSQQFTQHSKQKAMTYDLIIPEFEHELEVWNTGKNADNGSSFDASA